MTDSQMSTCYTIAFRIITFLGWPFRTADKAVEWTVLEVVEMWIRVRVGWDEFMEGEWKD